MPPTRTAPELASTSKPIKPKAPAMNGNTTKENAESILPDLALPKSFSRTQAQKAVGALLAYAKKAAEEKDDTELLAREEHVWLTLGLKSGAVKKKVSPVKIQLPHPALPPPPATSICLLTKDPQREYKDLLETENIKFISRVVGVEKLKGKFKPFEARRQLMKEHDMFLCDERVVGLMPGLLGKIFYEAKKLPIPVNLRKKDLKTELAQAVNSTYFIPTTGTSVSVRIATPSTSTPSQTLHNLLSAIPPVISSISGGWENVLSIGIKTSTSVLLPVWSSSLAGRFDAHSAATAAGKEGEEKKEKRKSVFEEWAEEEKAENERVRKYLRDNGEEVPEDLKSEGKAKGKKVKKVQEVEVDEDVSSEDGDVDMDSGDDDAEDAQEDSDDEEQEEVEAPAPAPKKAATASTTTSRGKKSSSAPVKSGKKTSQIAAKGKSAKTAIVGSGGKRK